MELETEAPFEELEADEVESDDLGDGNDLTRAHGRLQVRRTGPVQWRIWNGCPGTGACAL